MNEGNRNVRCFSPFKNSYGKVRAELGFFKTSCLLVHFFLIVQGSSQLIKRIPVGLCEWKITIIHPILTIVFQNVLRTFEAESLKIFKNIQHLA